MRPVLTFPLVGAAVSQCSGQGPRTHGDSHQPLSALGFEGAQAAPKLQLVKHPWCLVLPRKKKKNGFLSMAGAREGGGSTTVCHTENPTVHICISLLPTMVLHCR